MEYECTYRSPVDGSTYDFESLCQTGAYSPLYPFQYTDASNRVYVWNVCGTAPSQCIPTWKVAYNGGSALQLFNDGSPDPGSNCTDVYGNPATCTQNCEMLSIGPPTLSSYDPTNPSAGVNITHPGVRTLAGSPFGCDGTDPTTGLAPVRRATQVMLCDSSTDFRMGWVRETSECSYEIVMYTSKACGCTPSCYGKNCGPDGCGGFCGGLGHAGGCPDPFVCTDDTAPDGDGVCCKADCNGRNCGGDGCGGFCGSAGDGSCPTGNICTKYQICAYIAQPSPAARVVNVGSQRISTTTPGDQVAAVLGGVASAFLVAAGMGYYGRVRSAITGRTAQ